MLFVTFLAFVSVFHPYPYDNVVTRWALIRQISQEGTLRIDPYLGLTSDLAASDGHIYCDKAVLLSLAGAAIHKPLMLMGLRSSPDAYPVGGMGRYIVERILVGGSLLLLLILLRRHLAGLGVRPAMPMLAVGLGSILLPYSTLLYGHVTAAMFLFASFCLAKRRRYVLADLTGALAAAVEFPALLVYVILLLYRRRDYWNSARILRVPLMLALALLPQMVHNLIAFGSPATMGYTLETAEAFSGMGRGFFGFTFPKSRHLYLLLLSPERGLLFYMPWIALGFAGFFRGRGALKTLRNDPLPTCIAAYILLFAAYYMPTGGWAYGPRHLIPVVPFAAVGLGRFVRRSPRRAFVAWALLFPAILQALLGSFGEVHLPVHPVEQPVPIPQLSISLSMLLEGHHAYWLLGSAGAAIVTLAAVLLWLRLGLSVTSPSWWALGALLAWGSLTALAPVGWGGKVDYYRGVLAEHRREYSLAADYYLKAMEDPAAPRDVIGSRLESCRAAAERTPRP